MSDIGDRPGALAAADAATKAKRLEEAALEFEFGARQRVLLGWQRHVFFWAAVSFTAFHLAVLNLIPIEPFLFRAIHVAWGTAIGFAIYTLYRGDRTDRVPWFDWLLIAAAIGCGAYIAIELDDLLFRGGVTTTTGDLLVGTIGLLLVLEFTRRTSGAALPIVAIIFTLYCFVGPWLPGVLYHRGFSFERVVSYLYFGQDGVFGVTTYVSSTYIILFIAFAAFLQASKAGDWFNDLSVALIGWARGGPAKVAVVSGALFGTISGSAVANVVASGMITIPMMRRVGYSRATAGAIEATSSTGGQITPPVMGAGAFIMAEVTGIPYGEIALAAVIPAGLFYVASYAHCHLHALKNDLRGIPLAELPPLWPILMRAYLFVPVVILVWALIAGYSPFRAGTLGLISAVVASWLGRESRMGPMAVIRALEAAARDTVQLVAVCACAGIIVGVIALTGIGGRFSTMMLALAGQSQLLAMVFAMVIALILGMGMPTTAAYAVAASVVAPGLIALGVGKLVAHMFIFYYAVISAITPPVALASFAAAGMAQADTWKTSWIAVKLGLATFIVPFMFFYSPLLLMQGPAADILLAVATAAIGVVVLACSTEGWLIGPLPLALRAVLFVAALLLIRPGEITDLIGIALTLVVWAYLRWRNKSGPTRLPA